MTQPIPDSFAETGLYAQVQPDQQITQFEVVGERSSATNLMMRLLKRNSALQAASVLGWKHGFVQPAGIPPSLAVIVMVRRADDWARSMFAKPWHAEPDLQSLPFGDFLRSPWRSIVDHKMYFDGARKLGTIGQPLQHDRDPMTGLPFANLFALRRAKMTAHLSYLARDCTCVLVRAEALQNDPQGMTEGLLASLGHSRKDGPFNEIKKRAGWRFRTSVGHRPAPPDALSAEDMAFLRSQIDAPLEARLGYTYD